MVLIPDFVHWHLLSLLASQKWKKPWVKFSTQLDSQKNVLVPKQSFIYFFRNPMNSHVGTAGRECRTMYSTSPHYSDESLCEIGSEIMAVMQLHLLCVGTALVAGDATACQIRLADISFSSFQLERVSLFCFFPTIKDRHEASYELCKYWSTAYIISICQQWVIWF